MRQFARESSVLVLALNRVAVRLSDKDLVIYADVYSFDTAPGQCGEADL